MGYKDFAVGEVLTSQDVDNFLMRQTVMVFDDSASRATAIGTAIAEGMTSYLKDTDSLEYYDGSSWLNVNDNTDAIPKAVLAAQGDLIYGASAGSATALSIGTAGQFLTTNGTVPSWTDISTAGDIITTQGDLIIGDASGDPSRLAIGTADQVLTSNGTTMTWADAGGGGGWTLLSTTSMSGSSSIVISSIDQSYKNLRIEIWNAALASDASVFFRFKNSTSNLTAWTIENASIQNPTLDEFRSNAVYIADVTTLDAGYFISGLIEITNYAETSTYKPITIYGSAADDAGNGGGYFHHGSVIDNLAIDGLQVATSGGINFNGGSIKIYGGN